MGERHAEPAEDDPRTPKCVRKASSFLNMNFGIYFLSIGLIGKNILFVMMLISPWLACYDVNVKLFKHLRMLYMHVTT